MTELWSQFIKRQEQTAWTGPRSPPEAVLIFELPDHDAADRSNTHQLHTISKSGYQPSPFGPAAMVVELTGSERVRVGRDSDHAVVIEHPSLSRLHAWFEHGPRGWRLVDAGSRNGTVVNGKRLSARQPVELGRSALIGFGEVSAQFLSAEELMRSLLSPP